MKYKQRGYRDTDGPKGRRQETDEEREARQDAREAARKVRHAISRDASVVMRCADCGYQAPGEVIIAYDTECPKCHSSLHNCRNCRHFDSAARFQCRKPVEKAVASKTIGNHCDLYEARAVLDSTGKRAERPKSAAQNPRQAFDDLFKK